jgi:hypothetical protein
MGRGIQMVLATPVGSPKSVRSWMKLPCKSIPELMFSVAIDEFGNQIDNKAMNMKVFCLTSSLSIPLPGFLHPVRSEQKF